MKKAIIIILSFVCISNSLDAESWFNNFKRYRILFGYEDISYLKNFYFKDQMIPEREASMSLKTLSLNLGLYLPVYGINDNLAIGISPLFSVLSGEVASTYNGRVTTSGNPISFLALKFIGSIDLKYGGDALLKKEVNKLGAGVGLAYFYDYFFHSFSYNYNNFALKLETVYMFRNYLGLVVNGYFPLTKTHYVNNIKIYGYSINVGLIGSFGYDEEGKRTTDDEF